MRAAIVDSGVVVNIVEASEELATCQGWIVSDTAQIGMRWDGHEFHPQPKWADLASGTADVKSCAQRMACEKRNTVTAGISAAEMASWPIKQSEAVAFAKTQDAATAPALSIEAGARGMPLSDLVDRVLRNAQQLAALEAMIAGRCGAICDAADAAKSFDDLEKIRLDEGWPL